MSDQSDGRARSGSSADRKMTQTQAFATGAGASLAIGAADWFFQCTQGGWHWVVPNQQMIEMGAPLVLLPLGLWVAKVLSLIGTIITNKLQKDADT